MCHKRVEDICCYATSFVYCSPLFFLGLVVQIRSLHYRFSNNRMKEAVNYQTLSPKDLAKSVVSEGGWSNLLVFSLPYGDSLVENFALLQIS